MNIQPKQLKFKDQIIVGRLILLVSAASSLTLLLFTNLHWTTPILFAMLGTAVCCILSGMMLIFIDCPGCKKFFYLAEGEPVDLKVLLKRSILQSSCIRCGKHFNAE